MAPAATLNVGDPAPDVTVRDDSGRTVRLADYKGKRVVLYFYPQADTPGCTLEAKAFRDRIDRIEALGAVVVGVSPDAPQDQLAFKEKCDLPFTLLADEGGKVAEQFGVWVEKERDGRRFMGARRATFIIGPDGTIEQVFPEVDVEGHVDEVIATLEKL